MKKKQNAPHTEILVVDYKEASQIIHEELDECADRHAVFRVIQKLTARSFYAAPQHPEPETKDRFGKQKTPEKPKRYVITNGRINVRADDGYDYIRLPCSTRIRPLPGNLVELIDECGCVIDHVSADDVFV